MTKNTPLAAGFFQPAEWEPHQSCWLAWPSHENLWQENLPFAQAEFAALCHAISEPLNILIPTPQAREAAAKALDGLTVRYHSIPFGDIWLRDTAPIFLKNSEGRLAAVRFGFNGWGEKYVLPHDSEVSSQIAKATESRGAVVHFEFPWILEGGSVDVDGQGNCLTTRQCLLNPNRNPSLSLQEIEHGLREALGVKRVLWLNDGLLNDHTDGHIDTIARFIAPGTVTCMEAENTSDPNYKVMKQIAADLRAMDLKVISLPSPGAIRNEDEEIMPASYTNFYIANSSVVVPTYGSPNDQVAVDILSKCFPGRKVVGLSAKAILSGGGAFHCITQQQPKTMAR